MNKIIVITAAIVLALGISEAQTKDNSKRVLPGGVLLIDTTTLCQDVEGYMGPTPVQIKIKKDTIADITPLSNEETPAYFAEAARILKKWIGLTPAKGIELEVDAVSGATFSSEALIENVKAGLRKAIE